MIYFKALDFMFILLMILHSLLSVNYNYVTIGNLMILIISFNNYCNAIIYSIFFVQWRLAIAHHF